MTKTERQREHQKHNNKKSEEEEEAAAAVAATAAVAAEDEKKKNRRADNNAVCGGRSVRMNDKNNEWRVRLRAVCDSMRLGGSRWVVQ